MIILWNVLWYQYNYMYSVLRAIIRGRDVQDGIQYNVYDLFPLRFYLW